MAQRHWLFTALVACVWAVIGQAGEAKAQFTDCSAITGMPPSECQALVDLYDSTNGDNWTTKTGWKQTTTPCTWSGVTCSGGHVTSLGAINYNLVGTIPSSIGNLKSLIILNLRENGLNGSIPSNIGDLTNLTQIQLQTNHLTGIIPVEIGNLTKLNYIYLHQNQLSGNIPAGVCNSKNLIGLLLHSNQLSGSIPTEIGSLTKLTSLNLSSNQLSGDIPPSIGNMVSLGSLQLSGNQLSGSIPNEIGNLTNLTTLILSYNQLIGSIPTEIGNLTKLTILYLSSNQLIGDIPPSIGNLVNLTDLRLSSNQLSGSIPTEIGNLTKLTILYLYYNQLIGPIPASIGNLASLTDLRLYINRLSGSIPVEIGNLTNLSLLYIYNNQLSGQLPDSISNLTKLGDLQIQRNELTGELPSSILNMNNLWNFEYYANHFLVSVKGRIVDSDNLGIEGVTINAGGPSPTSAITAADGTFTVKIPDQSFYTLTPVKAGYDFSPVSLSGELDTEIIGGLELAGQDFTGDISRRAISGTATAGGSPLAGVTVTGSGTLGSQTTDASGHYSFSGVLYGTSYTLTPSKNGYSFSPTSAGGTVTENATHDFLATLNDSDGDGLSDLDEALHGTNPDKADTDGDGVSDSQEIASGSDPLDDGSAKPTRPTTLCAEWNGFLGMWNVMEHVNTGPAKLSMANTLQDFAGTAQAPVSFSLKPGYQYDLLVHGMTGFEANRYGLICSTAANGQPGDLDGRMVFYKPDTTTGGYQFAFAMPLGNGLTGTQTVPYNTYQPSLDPQEAANLAANWIQLTNLSATKQTGTLVFYDREGTEITRQAVTLKAGARFDYSAHDLAGLKQVGIVEWIPTATTARFQLRNVRYYYRADGVTVPLGDDFESAFQLEGIVGSGQVLTAPLDTENASAVLELANTLNEEVKAEVRIYPASGSATGSNALHHQTYNLKPHATYHLIADAILNGGKGIATVQGNKPGSVIATAMQYGRTETLGIQTVYGIQASEPLGTVMRGSYNTYLKQGCRLLMVNPGNAEAIATVAMKRYDGTEVKYGEGFRVPAHGLTDYDLCAQEQENVYGVVTVQPATPNTIFATVLRIGENEQYRFPTPVRQ